MAEEFMECLRRVYWRLIDEEVAAAALVAPLISEAYHRFPERRDYLTRSIVRVEATEDAKGPLITYSRTKIPYTFSQLTLEAISGGVRPSAFVQALNERKVENLASGDEHLRDELRLGASVMSAYLEVGFGPDFARKVNAMLDNRGVVPAIQATVLVAALALGMVATMHGTSEAETLGLLLSRLGDDNQE